MALLIIRAASGIRPQPKQRAPEPVERLEQQPQEEIEVKRMDGITTVLVGAMGLHEQENGNWWARGPGGLIARIKPNKVEVKRNGKDEVGAAIAGDDTSALSDSTFTKITGYYATIEIAEEPIALGYGETIHDAAAACTEQARDLFDVLGALFGVGDDEEG